MAFNRFEFVSLTNEYHQLWRRLSVPHVPNAASSQNLGNPVVAAAKVLGSENVEVLTTINLITRGTRA